MPAARPPRLAAAARAVASSPVVAALGWLALLVPAYWSLVDEHGQWLFKLDSFVYYEAVRQWLDGGDLYSWYANPGQHLWPFTYTPLAAWVISPLTWMSYQQATVLLIVATPLCAAVTAYAVLRRLAVAPRMARSLAPWLALLGVIALEPFPKTMEYAQVNAILMALVAVDLFLVPERSRWRGALSGLAAAIKLTPAVAILVLLAARFPLLPPVESSDVAPLPNPLTNYFLTIAVAATAVLPDRVRFAHVTALAIPLAGTYPVDAGYSSRIPVEEVLIYLTSDLGNMGVLTWLLHQTGILDEADARRRDLVIRLRTDESRSRARRAGDDFIHDHVLPVLKSVPTAPTARPGCAGAPTRR